MNGILNVARDPKFDTIKMKSIRKRACRNGIVGQGSPLIMGVIQLEKDYCSQGKL